jgi:hypothetical protein
MAANPIVGLSNLVGGYQRGRMIAEDRDYELQRRALQQQQMEEAMRQGAEDRAAIKQVTGYSPAVLKAQEARYRMAKMQQQEEEDRIANVTGQAARMIGMGNTQQANQFLSDAGMGGVQAEDDPQDFAAVHIQTPSGKYKIKRTDLISVVSDPKQFARDAYALDKSLAGWQQKAQLEAGKQEFQAGQKQLDRESRERIAKMRQSVAGRAGVGGATLALINERSKQLEATGVPHNEAWAQAYGERVLQQGRAGAEQKVQIRVLQDELKMHLNNYDEQKAAETIGKMKRLSGLGQAKSKPTAAPQKKDDLPRRPWEKR